PGLSLSGHFLWPVARAAQVGDDGPSLFIVKIVGRHLGPGNTFGNGRKNLAIAAAVNPSPRRQVWPFISSARVTSVAQSAIVWKQGVVFLDRLWIPRERILDGVFLAGCEEAILPDQDRGKAEEHDQQD